MVTVFNVFSITFVTFVSISEALAPGYAVITMIVLVSISGNRSIDNLLNEKRPIITIATKQRAVVIGFFTADEYKLITFSFYI
ncbi:hypothetical protein Cfast33896_03420 [Coprobacter fastidiosus]|nr:hypothetical protein Cfast33896_03420 [Coprobacter fastidiosus]